MASNNSDNKQIFELLLKCALCNVDLNDINQPKSLPCLHTFCTPCLTNQHQRFIQDNNIFKCPVCHKSVDRSPGGSGIIDNLKLDSIIEKLLHVRRLQQSERHCEMCPKLGEVSTHWCQDCNKFLCDGCRFPHGIYKPKDKVIDVSQGGVFDKVSDFIVSTECCRHEKKFNIYCSKCEICLCSDCLLEHLNENEYCKQLGSIEAVAPDSKLQGRQLLEEMGSHLEKGKQQIQDMKLKIGHLRDHYFEKSEEIWENVEETVRRLKENARTFIAEFEAGTKSEIDELEKLIQLKQDHIKEMEIIDKNFRLLLQSFNNVDILHNYSRIKSKCTNLLRKPQNDVSSTLHGLNMVYNTWFLQIHEMSKDVPLGYCRKELELTKAFSMNESYDAMEELNRLLSGLQLPVPCLVYHKHGKLPIDDTDVFCIFVADEKNVLMGISPPTVLCEYNKNVYSDIYGNTRIKSCTDWCRSSSDDIYLVDRSSIWLRRNATYLKNWKRITLKSKYLSICNCFGRILVCDRYRRVYLLNIEGTVCSTVLGIRKRKGSFHKIRCGPFKDTFLLFDDQDKKLLCYNLLNSKCLFSLKVGNVKDLCTDKYGNIYVAEQNEVYVISPDNLEKHDFFAIKPQGQSYRISVGDVFYFASDNSGKWTLEKFRLHYRQRSS